MRHSVVLFGLSIGVAVAAACSSSSSNNSADAGATDAAVSNTGGPMCSGAPCSSGDVCCAIGTSPSCKPAGLCQGSFLTCSAKANCPGSQVCCFTYTDDTSTNYTSKCEDSCPAPPAAYVLCGSDTDCASGESCSMGSVTLYCAPPGTGFPAFDGNFPAFDGNFPAFDGNFPGRPPRDAGGSNPDTGSSSQDDGATAADTGPDQ
jgi:hypothetical protein